jgi:hypothetical protein
VSDPLYQVAVAAVEIKRAAPREFDKLVEAIKVLEMRCDSEFRSASPNVIFIAQGKAQLVVQLRTKLENCMEIVRRGTNG